MTDTKVEKFDPKQATPAEFISAAQEVAKWPAPRQASYLAHLGEHLGVRAELGELILYQGRPYLTVDGRLRIAHESGLLDGLRVRPAYAKERADYGAAAEDQLWIAELFKKGYRHPFVGYGHVTAGDRNPVTKTHPREMAKKRAKYDALRTAFPPDADMSKLVVTEYASEVEDVEEPDLKDIKYAPQEEVPALPREMVAALAQTPDPYDAPRSHDKVAANVTKAAPTPSAPAAGASGDDYQDDTELELHDQRAKQDAIRSGH